MSREFTIQNKAVTSYTQQKWNYVGDRSYTYPMFALFSNSSGVYAGGREPSGVIKWNGNKWESYGHVPSAYDPFSRWDWGRYPDSIVSIFEWKKKIYCGLRQRSYINGPLFNEYNKITKKWKPILFEWEENWSLASTVATEDSVYFFGFFEKNEGGINSRYVIKWDGKKFIPIFVSNNTYFWDWGDWAIRIDDYIYFSSYEYESFEIKYKIRRLEINTNIISEYYSINNTSEINMFSAGKNIGISFANYDSSQNNSSVMILDQDKNVTYIPVTGAVNQAISCSEGIYMSGPHSEGFLSLWDGEEVYTKVVKHSDRVWDMLSGSDGIYMCASWVPNSYEKSYVSHVIKYDGNELVTLQTDAQFQKTENHVVTNFLSCSDGVYISGFFWGKQGRAITRWDGEKFNKLGEGLPGFFWFDMASGSAGIYVNQRFYEADEDYDISLWNGYEWSGINLPVYGSADCIACDNDNLYVSLYTHDNSFVGYKKNDSGWTQIFSSSLGNTYSTALLSNSSGVYFYNGINTMYRWNGAEATEITCPSASYGWPFKFLIKGDGNKILYQTTEQDVESVYYNTPSDIVQYDPDTEEWSIININKPEGNIVTTHIFLMSSSLGYVFDIQRDVQFPNTERCISVYRDGKFYKLGTSFNTYTVGRPCSGSEGIYIGGYFTNHGNGVSLYTEKEIQTLRPINCNNNNVISLRSTNPYEVKLS